MNVFHYLMSSMCAHPGDSTVQIHSNGVSDKARFSFNMFRFTESFSYIYLHCEGRITYSAQNSQFTFKFEFAIKRQKSALAKAACAMAITMSIAVDARRFIYSHGKLLRFDG